jgi:pantetheine-phosphate adenylyltransferase
MPANIAICAGSFDPPSYGHLNIIGRALKVCDKVTVAIATDNSKSSLFTAQERVDILKELFKDEPRVEIDCFEGLLVSYAKEKKANVLIRGIRSVADYEFELQMSLANRMLDSEIETVFMMTEGHLSHISSSIIKQIIQLGGSAKKMVHPFVEQQLKDKIFGKGKE